MHIHILPGYQQDPSQGRRESRNVPCSGYYTKEDTDRGDASKERRDSDRRKVGGGGRRVGYRTESAESGSADPDTYHSQDMEVRTGVDNCCHSPFTSH